MSVVICSVMLLASSCQEYHVMKTVKPGESPHSAANVKHSPISCQLNVADKQNIADGVYIDFNLLNHSDKELSVLTWYTPLEGFYSKLFIITDQYQAQVLYQGPMVKRVEPIPADYQIISAHDSVRVQLDLTLVYHLIPGDYKVQLNKKTLQVIENEMVMSIYQCQTETVNFRVD